MKFRSPRFKRLRVHGVGRFVDGVLETDDPAAVAHLERLADRYGIRAVADSSDPFDPSEHNVETVNAYLAAASPAERARVLDAEVKGRGRATVVGRWADGDEAPSGAEPPSA